MRKRGKERESVCGRKGERETEQEKEAEKETNRGREIGGGCEWDRETGEETGTENETGSGEKGTNKPANETDTLPHRYREQTFSCQGGGEEGRDGQGVPG